MDKRNLLYISSFFFLVPLRASNEAAHDLNEGLASWNRMKRDAGYYTESGVWRGGLWRPASDTDSEVYRCLEDRESHCRRWTMSEESRKKREYGNCTCAATDLSYCGHWECKSTHVDKGADCKSDGDSTACVDLYLQDTLTCVCDLPAPNQMYCSRWSCRDESSNGYSEDEDYQCLVEDVSGEYCYRWTGNISSNSEIESSVCECFKRGQHFCRRWECRERALIRCAAHPDGWCSVEIGVGIGGGIGLLYLLAIGICFRNPSDDLARDEKWCERMWIVCFLVHAGLPTICLFLHPIQKTYRRQVFRILVATLFVCLPWLAGVLIWGGILSGIIVLPIWFSVLFFFLCLRYYQRNYKNRQVHPSSQIQLQ